MFTQGTIMKNTLISLILIAFSLSLTSCGGGDTEDRETPPSSATFQAGTYPRFDPIVADLPFNTDLIFAKAAATDGTADVGAATDPVRAALNQMDGFSTSAFFDILISGSVDPATVSNASVFLLQLNTGTADALNPANIVASAPIVGPASYTTTVVSLDGGNNNVIRIRPTLPLKAKTKYLVFITNDVKDAAGRALTPSWSYNALRDATYAVGNQGSLAPVRNAILGWEALAGGFLAAVSNGALTAATAKQKLVLSYTFTTTDPQTPLVAMASPRAAVAASQIAAQVPAQTAITNATNLDMAGALPSPKARSVGLAAATGVDINILTANALAANVSKLYTGYIQLPYYLTAPGDLPFGEFLKRSWIPDTTLAGLMGITLPTDVGGSYNLTYRYPFAKRTSTESVPLQITMPLDSLVPGYAGAANCGQIYSASGYPVVIYVHGITSDRASILSLAHTLASRCVATVAIDLPMHGIAANSPFVNALNVERNGISALYGTNAPHERHFNVGGAAGAPAPMNFTNPTANDGSGAQFVNLAYFGNNRDNLRQGVVDLLNLNASLANVDTALKTFLPVGIDRAKVYVVGMSLGGILSTNFVTSNQLAIGAEAQLGMTPVLNPIRGMVLSASGTQVSQIMLNSATFGPSIKAGLAAAGVTEGTSNYERFIYAIQSTLDSGDPVSFSQTLANLPDSLKMPLLLQQVKNDLVIPNSAAAAPLTGTEAMARLMGMTQLVPGTTQLGRGHVKMNAGVHTSLLRPDVSAPQITAEFQTQVVSFVLGAGNVSIGAAASANVEVPAM
jgi:pimeloyl-ACP methyl ester carboxylesterase